MHKAKQVVAFEKSSTIVFRSISEAAGTYGVNKKIIIDRINDGSTLKDGYTTLDWHSTESETVAELREMRQYIPEDDFAVLYGNNGSRC